MKKFDLTTWMMFIIGAVLLLFLYPFVVPLILAGLFAFALEPLMTPYFKKLKISRARVSGLVLAVIVLIVYLPLGLLLGRTIVHLSKEEYRNSIKENIVSGSAVAKDFLTRTLQQLNSSLGIDESNVAVATQLENFEQSIIKLAGRTAESIGGWVSELPVIFASFLVFMAALYFFLSEAPRFKKAILKLEFFPAEDVSRAIRLMQESCKSSVLSAFVVGLLQATIITVGVLFIGFGDAWLVFPLAFLASFIPVIGVGPIALSLGLGALATGHTGKAIAFVILALIVGTADNIFRAYLLGGKEAYIHPILGLLVIIGSVIVMGLPGLFVGPVVAHLGAHLYSSFMNQGDGIS